MIPDTNAIIRAYLVTCTTLTALVGTRIYCPRLPENTTLPAISFFTRGGVNNPYIPDMVNPSIQFDCWAEDLITARNVYNKLYDNLQGIQNQAVVVGSDTYYIKSAVEEVAGQDLIDEIPGYFRVLTFFKIIIT